LQTEVQDCKEQINILSNQITSRFDELKRKIDLLLEVSGADKDAINEASENIEWGSTNKS